MTQYIWTLRDDIVWKWFISREFVASSWYLAEILTNIVHIVSSAYDLLNMMPERTRDARQSKQIEEIAREVDCPMTCGWQSIIREPHAEQRIAVLTFNAHC